VWGLDDYQFLPFIWGSAQLISHPHIRPKSIHSSEVLEGYSKDYLYLASVAFVKQVCVRGCVRACVRVCVCVCVCKLSSHVVRCDWMDTHVF
jgi:hypothetical protein